MGSSWAVVMLAREPAIVVMAHLRWHLAQGAREVFLYLDDPADPVAQPARALPGVHLTLCDTAFWHALNGGRPALQTRRQTLIATEAYRRTTCDWMIHIDADEFLWVPDLGVQLAKCPHDMLHIPVAERVWTRPRPEHLFEGAFRTPRPGPVPDPEMNGFFSRGMAGHPAGKSASRTGCGLEILPHMPRRMGQVPPNTKARDGWVLHFDGLTPLHFLHKMLAYARYTGPQRAKLFSQHRQAQVAMIEDSRQDAAQMHAFLTALKWGDARDLMQLDMSPNLTGPDGLTCAAFDAMLPQRPDDVVEKWRTRRDSNS